MRTKLYFILFILVFLRCSSEVDERYDVIVLGEGTAAVSAALQSARSGAKTIYINPLPWHGGMLTSAGVSATDGNHNLSSGIWDEWRGLLRDHYGGADSLFTGWVSNTMFEPHVGHSYWQQLLDGEENLIVLKSTTWSTIKPNENGWQISLASTKNISGKILIDGTDLGDVAAELGVDYNLGMDSRADSGESIAPTTANEIIQDMTYVAILKDYGASADKTIPKPKNYDASLYHCSCAHNCEDETVHMCDKLLSYGRLPNDKYMINWPINGNDYNVNTINLIKEERVASYEEAKLQTLGFIYYMQTELGYRNLGIAEDEFPTEDNLAILPYHREGRRINGLVRFNLNHIQLPFDYELYRTGISVGDYPVDHHNYKSENPPQIDFPKIPSFNIPMGSLIPKAVPNLLVADKAISVTNIVNGCTRLQPVVLLTGQAAGVMAALASRENISPNQLDVRSVQAELINHKAHIMPYQDVDVNDKYFDSIQRVGATGILKGVGVPFKWANKTLFYPDSLVATKPILQALSNFDARLQGIEVDGDTVTKENVVALFNQISKRLQLKTSPLPDLSKDQKITRRIFAKMLDQYLDPFNYKQVDITGSFLDFQN